jgi:hypothetical protein
VSFDTWTNPELRLWTGKHTFSTWKKIFAALAANGLAINLEKCVFAIPSLEFLGHKFRLQDWPQRPIMPPR